MKLEDYSKYYIHCKAGSEQQYYALNHLKIFKEIIGGADD